MTPSLTLAAHMIAVVSLVDDQAHTVQPPRTVFPTYEACVKAIPSFIDQNPDKAQRNIICVPK